MKNYGFVIFIGILLFLFNTNNFAQNSQNNTENNSEKNTENNSPLLKYVPADSIFFSGNSELFNLDDFPFFQFNQASSNPFSQALNQDAKNNLGPGLAFLSALSDDFERIAVKGNTALQTHYGLAKKMALALYSVNLNPVLKITLADEQAFLAVLTQAEKKSGLQHQEGMFEQQKYWFYSLDNNYQIIVAIQASEDKDGDKIATLALLNQHSTDYQKQLIFGLRQAEQSIKEKVTQLEKNNGYMPISISFIDFELLIQSIFPTKNTPDTKNINNSWGDLLGEPSPLLVSLQNSECKADILKLVQEVPLFVGGYTQYELQGQSMKIQFEALLELKNKNIKMELNQFRGFIPSYVREGAEENIFALGLGVNLSQISPFFVYVTKTIRESDFQCEPLKELQKNTAQLNPLTLAMFAGVLDGVHGLSFAIQDFKVNRTKAEQKNNRAFELSSLLTLSAENPLKVWQMMSAFVPQIAMISPTASAQKLNLPELNNLGLDVSVAIKGQHLVLFSNNAKNDAKNNIKQERMIKQLAIEKIHANGFFQESINYTHLNHAMKELRYLLSNAVSFSNNGLLQSQAPMSVESCIDFDESIAMLSRYSGFIDYKNDFTEQGWLHFLTVDMEFKATKQMNYQIPGKFTSYLLAEGCQWKKDGQDELLADGSGLYQAYSDDEQCFIFETRYRWTHEAEQLKVQYLSERSRAEGQCNNEFTSWSVPKADYINDVCLLRPEAEGNYSCLYQWDDGVLNKSLNKRM